MGEQLGQLITFGTNADRSKSDEYCNFCYQGGRFTDEGITMEEKITRVAGFLVQEMKMAESEALATARASLPTLKRWSNQQQVSTVSYTS